MGHAENKCGVRFSMDNDDGRREWSGELRVDQRRGGGRQTSRWLREERDGGGGFAGGGRRSQGGAATEIPSMGPIPADVSETAQNQPQVHTALIANNNVTIPMMHNNSNQGENSSANHITVPKLQPVTDRSIQTSRQLSLHIETEKTQPSLANQFSLIPKTGLSSLNDQSIIIPSLPPPHLFQNNNHINSSSLSNNSLIFTSQPKITASLKHSNRKQITPHRTHPTNHSTRPNPISTQPHTQPINRPGPELAIPNPNQKNAVDMETHTEKKRRREGSNQTEKNDEEPTHHFLSAGPGSQDCREQ
jgi:hypothetical protein